MELKSLYQSQLESVVREKLAEFQSQLETARDDMRHQLDAELAASRESARRQQQSLVNRYQKIIDFSVHNFFCVLKKLCLIKHFLA